MYDYREYIIKKENDNFILRFEIYEKNIYIIISLNDNIEYNYKTKMSLSTIVNKLELNPVKFSNFELILKLIDVIYNNKNISINITNDEYCILLIKFTNVLKESTYEFKINKNYMKMNDKFNILFNQMKTLKNNNDKIEQMNNKYNELNEKIEIKNKEIKDIINKKDNLFKEMKNQLFIQEKKVIEKESKINELEKIIERNRNKEQLKQDEIDKLKID